MFSYFLQPQFIWQLEKFLVDLTSFGVEILWEGRL